MTKKIPMTRSALRRAIRPYQALLIAWFAESVRQLPRKLRRAGFKRLPTSMLGVEREVLLGPGIVVKTAGYSYRDEPASSPRFRRVKAFAPTISIARDIIVQPRGRVLAQCRGPKWDKVRAKYDRVSDRITEKFGIGDTHEGNFAYFPDRSVRCIDY